MLKFKMVPQSWSSGYKIVDGVTVKYNDYIYYTLYIRRRWKWEHCTSGSKEECLTKISALVSPTLYYDDHGEACDPYGEHGA